MSEINNVSIKTVDNAIYIDDNTTQRDINNNIEYKLNNICNIYETTVNEDCEVTLIKDQIIKIYINSNITIIVPDDGLYHTILVFGSTAVDNIQVDFLNVEWRNEPMWSEDHTYEVSILNNSAIWIDMGQI